MTTLARKKAARQFGRNFFYLVEVDHPAGTAWFTTRYRNVEYDAGDGEKTWRGVSRIASLELPEESGAIEIAPYAAELAGVDADMEYLAQYDVQGYSFKVWIAFADDAGKILATELIQDDYQDFAEWINSGEGTGTIRINIQGNFPFLANQTINRVTAEQQAMWLEKEGESATSDTGFDRQHLQPDENEGWWPLT